MIEGNSPHETLEVSRVFAATKERVFRAWTSPEELKKWWRPGEGWTTPVAEVDLRVGGKFSLGAKPPVGDLHLVRGEFQEVIPPDKLVYTWQVEGSGPERSIVTVEFRADGERTRVRIIHEMLTEKSAATSRIGWDGVLSSLQRVLG